MKTGKTAWVLACVVWVACSAASADLVQDFGITADSYIDSRLKPGYNDESTNFANANVDRVAINKAASGETVAGSPARGLFYLPESVWDYSPDQIVSATVSFYTWSDRSSTSNIYLYPMTRSWAVGTGAVPADGATWLTYDGTNSWTTTGGDYDASHSVVAIKGPDLGGGDRNFTWDITSLLNDPVTRAELQNYGAMLKITETPPSSGWLGAAFSSFEDATPINRPFVQVVTPEPASLLMLAAGLPVVGWFRRRSAR
jgi:hypothetical protein